jgi:hypothetical protein
MISSHMVSEREEESRIWSGLFIFIFLFLLLCWWGVHCGIYKSSYNISNDFLNLTWISPLWYDFYESIFQNQDIERAETTKFLNCWWWGLGSGSQSIHQGWTSREALPEQPVDQPLGLLTLLLLSLILCTAYHHWRFGVLHLGSINQKGPEDRNREIWEHKWEKEVSIFTNP